MTQRPDPSMIPTAAGPGTSRRTVLLALGAGSVLAVAPRPGAAQTFPTKPVRIVVGFAAGGSSDLAARMVARRLEKQLGQTVLVVNQPGNNGAIAANGVARSDPDGHTMYLGNISLLSPAMTKVGFITVGKDLVPIGGVQAGPWFLFARASLPVTTMQEFVAYGKANPGKLNFGGASAVNSLVAEVIKNRFGITGVNVLFKGSAPVVQALLAGDIDYTTDILPAWRAQVAAGKVRALLYFGDKRSAFLPDVPASSEIGFSEFAGTRTAMWAPAGIPKAIQDRLSNELHAALSSEELAKEFRDGSSEATPIHAAEMGVLAARETQFWTEAARVTNFKPD